MDQNGKTFNFACIIYYRLAAAQEAALADQSSSGGQLGRKSFYHLADRMGGPRSQGGQTPAGGGPTSLFILSEDNIIRRYYKFVRT